MKFLHNLKFKKDWIKNIWFYAEWFNFKPDEI